MTSSPPPPPPRFTRPRFTPAPPPGPGGAAPPPGPGGPPRKGRGPLFWITVGCLGCVTLPLLLLALFAGVIGGGVFYMTREPVNVVKAQLAEIQKGELDQAYARFSDAGRERLSRSAFADLVEKHPALRDNADATFWNRSLTNDQLKLSGTLTARSGAKEAISYQLLRERGEWKIAEIRLGLDAETGDKP